MTRITALEIALAVYCAALVVVVIWAWSHILG